MISIIILTLNAENELTALLKKIKEQTIKDYEIIVIDSSSEDKTKVIAEYFRAKTITIKKKEFNHGLTRTLGAKKAKGEIIVYLTQDVVLENKNTLKNIILFLKRNNLAAAYGRQIPRKEATPINAYLRIFNYPEKSFITQKEAFLSDSFSVYQKKALKSAGWFRKTDMSEDIDIAARLINKGYKIGYCAEARVIHSHNLSIKEEYVRYKRLGIFYKKNRLLLSKFEKPEKRGIKYLFSGIKYLLKNSPFAIPEFILRSAIKLYAYKFG